MTRENDIKNAAWDYFQDLDSHHFHLLPHCNSQTDAFEAGAKWSDETHGKELMYVIQQTGGRTKREVINKACEYFRTHLWQNVDDDNDPIIESVHNITLDDFIKDFKRYLEE